MWNGIVFGVYGPSDSGKTTLIVKLVTQLSKEGYRVATVKCTDKSVSLDTKGKDTWRHMQAGSEATALSSADSIMIVKKKTASDDLNEILKFFDNDYDLIIVEGYKESDLPKIEVHRKEKGSPLSNLTELLAVATDERLETEVPQISLDDIKAITDIIEKEVNRQKSNH